MLLTSLLPDFYGRALIIEEFFWPSRGARCARQKILDLCFIIANPCKLGSSERARARLIAFSSYFEKYVHGRTW